MSKNINIELVKDRMFKNKITVKIKEEEYIIRYSDDVNPIVVNTYLLKMVEDTDKIIKIIKKNEFYIENITETKKRLAFQDALNKTMILEGVNDMSNPEITVNINILDKDIKRLEKVKQLLDDIKEIDSGFKLGNIIEASENTILIFNCDCLYKKEYLERMQRYLTNELKHKCIILSNGLTLDKAIGIDYAKGRDYTTVTYYNDEGNLVKEETTQYK